MIVGIGVDLVDISRFEDKVATTPKLLDRIFSAAESDAPVKTLAGRFAAKEALIKAMGGSNGISWQEVEISKNDDGKPVIQTVGKTSETLKAAGVTNLHLSISHDAGMAVAMVVAE
jgi:holo-[acyl-carrier protein] synthase